ncbi:MAG: hypothetical protein A3K19_28070 [Lentisphaerae bacterium RIFOXYB12_FULL_65_16]|nr:MAG: hypothetical protein A3K18_27855 [Lentisphaerae bacterium RIFOXYA12_64_32]OGV88148.1 MAG: hypothetical protein A3K19_28070 [Lentisphaerae bacterium RIFOXYB12_FULL_65_16]
MVWALALGAPPASLATDTDRLWLDINALIDAGDYDSALALLAELSMDPARQGQALVKAAEIYLQQGRPDRAAGVLEKAIALPDCADAANLLVKLLFRQRAFADIVRVAQMGLPVDWEPDVLRLLRLAYLAEQGTVPESLDGVTLTREAPSRLAWTLSGNSCMSQYAPFSDDRSIKDTEFHHGLSLGLSSAWRQDMTLKSKLSVERAESEDNPSSYHAYQAWLYGLRGGVIWTSQDGLTADLETGAVVASIQDYDDANMGGTESEWVYSASLTGTSDSDTREIRIGAYQDVFGSPTWSDYLIEKYQGQYVELALRPTPNWRATTRCETLRFTGDTEDYQTVSGTLTWYPNLFPSVSLTGGEGHEFRDRDEDILVAGVDWIGHCSAATTVLASVFGNANVTTREREVIAQLALTRKSGTRRFTVGVASRQELNVDKRRAAQLFFRVE